MYKFKAGVIIVMCAHKWLCLKVLKNINEHYQYNRL
jgi:hypothetical protein